MTQNVKELKLISLLKSKVRLVFLKKKKKKINWLEPIRIYVL